MDSLRVAYVPFMHWVAPDSCFSVVSVSKAFSLLRFLSLSLSLSPSLSLSLSRSLALSLSHSLSPWTRLQQAARPGNLIVRIHQQYLRRLINVVVHSAARPEP